MAQGALPGFRDFYPEQFAERAHVMNVWRDVARRFAFAEYDGPPLEPLELYTKKSGEEIVGQLYNFTDKGGRDIALRPEMTPTLARMAAAKAAALRKPIRWFSTPRGRLLSRQPARGPPRYRRFASRAASSARAGSFSTSPTIRRASRCSCKRFVRSRLPSRSSSCSASFATRTGAR